MIDHHNHDQKRGRWSLLRKPSEDQNRILYLRKHFLRMSRNHFLLCGETFPVFLKLKVQLVYPTVISHLSTGWQLAKDVVQRVHIQTKKPATVT